MLQCQHNPSKFTTLLRTDTSQCSEKPKPRIRVITHPKKLRVKNISSRNFEGHFKTRFVHFEIGLRMTTKKFVFTPDSGFWFFSCFMFFTTSSNFVESVLLYDVWPCLVAGGGAGRASHRGVHDRLYNECLKGLSPSTNQDGGGGRLRTELHTEAAAASGGWRQPPRLRVSAAVLPEARHHVVPGGHPAVRGWPHGIQDATGWPQQVPGRPRTRWRHRDWRWPVQGQG